ncbi:hypothetical protein LRS06_02585 [Hymenobacter sp. J193]|uniref:hypothetical protein n=1 Tax=Hymenobacter sp. J193 TaxID=2898429 RepID=UPI002151AC7D|nr:hypothetical protein [Hymenobacter sp. J193]MCR5886678.1 hypothetical protein [Hymenobacter sp. J193]
MTLLKPGLFNLKPTPEPIAAESPALETLGRDASFADRVLKKLGLVSSAADNLESENYADPDSVRIQRTMRQAGFRAAGQHNGTTHGLEVNLTRILANLHEQFDQNDRQQETQRKQKQGEINAVSTEIEYRQDERATLDNKLDGTKQKITDIKHEIHLLRTSPEDMHLQEPSRLALWISGTILAFLTVYLFVFYSSAIYSAFFKSFGADDQAVSRAIFDGQAFIKAWQDGFMEVLLMLTLPSAFLGLGYILHQFQKSNSQVKWLKIGGIILVTFIFDYVLAYGISKKIYDLNKAASFKDMPDYTMGMAIVDVDFWTIIFAGFVVYLIWGLLFDFFMEAHRLSNKVDAAITERQKQIQEKETECITLEEQIGKVKEIIKNLIAQRHQLEAQLMGVIIPAREWANYLMEFCDGWLSWMTGADMSHYKQNQCKATLDQFIERHLGQNTVLSYRSSEIDGLGMQGPSAN